MRGDFFKTFLFVSYISWLAYGEKAETPKFILEPGKPIEFHYQDGRVAQWKVGHKPPRYFSPTFKITENTCTGKENISGKFHVGVKQFSFSAFWSKHPDPKKIGVNVQLKIVGGAGNISFSEGVFLLNHHKKKFAKAALEIPLDFFEGEDFSWLPGSENREPPQNILFSRWDSERMVFNEETGRVENRTLQIGLGMDFYKKSATKLELRSTKFSSSFGSLVFLIGDLWALIIKQGESFCQITQKANLEEIYNEVSQYTVEAPSSFAPYVFGMDEFVTKTPFQAPFLFSEYYKNSGAYHAF